MKKTYEFIFKDVYGGDGITRPMPTEVKKLLRTRSSIKVRMDIGIPIESGYQETQVEKGEEQVNTFAYQDGYPTLRLGGSHGKLWGALKAARLLLYHLGKKEFRGAGILNMIQVSPVYVALEPLVEMETRTLPQILNTPGSPMIIQYYDVLPRAKATVTLEYPDEIDPQVKTLLEYFAQSSHFNKRRTTVESMKEVNNAVPY